MADIISVDFKTGAVTNRVSEAEQKEDQVRHTTCKLARNKQLINDMKGFLDEMAGQLDLESAVIFVPNEELDVYIKMDGTDINEADMKGVRRILTKLRQRNVKP